MSSTCTARKKTNNGLCITSIIIIIYMYYFINIHYHSKGGASISFRSLPRFSLLPDLFSSLSYSVVLSMSITTVDKELLEAATLSLQAQERLTAVLHRKLKTNEDASSKEGEIETLEKIHLA